MTSAEIELELSGLRRDLTQLAAQDETRRKSAQRLAYSDFGVASAFLMFGLVLYLNHNPVHIAFFLSAVVLICVGGNLIAMAKPRSADRTTSP